MSVKDTQSSSEVQIFNSMQENNSSLYELTSNLQLAQFSLRVNDLILTPSFRTVVQRLPVQYNPHVYTTFFETFGTHFVRQGTLGGRIHYFYVIKKSDVEESYSSDDEVKDCLSVEASIKIYGQGGSVSYSKCHSSSDKVSTSNHTSGMATQTIVANIGGSSDTALIFTADTIDPVKLQAYIESVKQNPAMLTKELDIICSLIPLTRMDSFDVVQSNCETALMDYLAHHGTEGCQSCMNGGMALNMNQTCYCACPEGTVGDMCELLTGNTSYFCRFVTALTWSIGSVLSYCT